MNQSINMVITKSPNKNAPTGNTTSSTSWKNMWRSAQHKALSCLLTQFNWLVSFSGKLIQTCHEASRLHLLLSRSFRRLRKIMNGSFWNTSGCWYRQVQWHDMRLSGKICFATTCSIAPCDAPCRTQGKWNHHTCGSGDRIQENGLWNTTNGYVPW